MLYKVRELAEELGIPDRTLRDWLAAGAPHERDDRRHIWVNGEQFAAWVTVQRKQRKKHSMAANEAYCMRCNKTVKLTDAEVVSLKAMLIQIQGNCPNCGNRVNRGGRRDQPAELFVG
jgi:endogenous inhibitor of DNA gyrase (YacG/DUF329 family)